MTSMTEEGFDYGELPATKANELRAAAENIRSGSTNMTDAIIQNGDYYLAAKRALPHGKFSIWVETACGSTLRTAQNHMRVAKFAEGKSESVSLLTPTAIYALSSKGVPPSVVERVLNLLKSNQIPTERDVLRMLQENTPERAQHPNKGAENHKARDLAAELLARVGPDFARTLAETPWAKVSGALRELLRSDVGPISTQDWSASSKGESEELEPGSKSHGATLYRLQVAQCEEGSIPAFLDRRTNRSSLAH